MPPAAIVTITFTRIELSAAFTFELAELGVHDVACAMATVSSALAPARTLGRSAPLSDEVDDIDLTAQRMKWTHSLPVAAAGAVTVGFTVHNDRRDGAGATLIDLNTTVDSPWAEGQRTFGNDSVTITFTVRTVAAAVAPPVLALALAPGDGEREPDVVVVPAQIIVEFTAIAGLYRPTGVDPGAVATGNALGAISAAVDGYTSADHKGRIFINRKPDGTWTKDTQYIDVTARLTISGLAGEPNTARRAGLKVKWSVFVPDDPSDDDPAIHRSDGALLDPADWDGQGRRKGAAGYDNEGVNPSWELLGGVWERLDDIPITVPRAAADPIGVPANANLDAANQAYGYTATTNTVALADDAGVYTRTSRVRVHCPNVRGDRLIVRAEAVDTEASIRLPAQTGIMTMWERLDVRYRRMRTAFALPIAQVPKHFEPLFVQMDFHAGALIDDIARVPAVDFPVFLAANFAERARPGWFCLLSTLLLDQAPALVQNTPYTGPARLRNRDDTDAMKDLTTGEKRAAAVNAVTAQTKARRYEYVDVPARAQARSIVFVKWPPDERTTEVKFDVDAEVINLEGFRTNKGIRQRMISLGYAMGPITTAAPTQEERALIQRFRDEHPNLGVRTGALVDDAKALLFQRWVNWRFLGGAADGNPNDEALAAGDNVAGVVSRLWFSPHDVQNKFTAGDGSQPHAYKNRLLYGPRHRQAVVNRKPQVPDAEGYGAPVDVHVVVKDQGGDTLGYSPSDRVTGVEYFSGQTLIATHHKTYRPVDVPADNFETEVLVAIVHELIHAFGMPHKCARWDSKAEHAQSCCMNYTPNWMVNPATNRLIAGTAKKVGFGICGMHIKEVRRVKLQDNPALQARGWR